MSRECLTDGQANRCRRGHQTLHGVDGLEEFGEFAISCVERKLEGDGAIDGDWIPVVHIDVFAIPRAAGVLETEAGVGRFILAEIDMQAEAVDRKWGGVRDFDSDIKESGAAVDFDVLLDRLDDCETRFQDKDFKCADIYRGGEDAGEANAALVGDETGGYIRIESAVDGGTSVEQSHRLSGPSVVCQGAEFWNNRSCGCSHKVGSRSTRCSRSVANEVIAL